MKFIFNEEYHGESTKRLYKSFNGLLSRGLDNRIEFVDALGAYHTVNFQIKEKTQVQKIYPFINEAVRLKILSFKDAVNAIGIENVN